MIGFFSRVIRPRHDSSELDDPPGSKSGGRQSRQLRARFQDWRPRTGPAAPRPVREKVLKKCEKGNLGGTNIVSSTSEVVDLLVDFNLNPMINYIIKVGFNLY